MSKRDIPLPLYTIYALAEPLNGVVRYVGLSNDVKKRYREHVQRANNQFEKDTWILSLIDQQLLPTLLILEENIAGEDKAREREEYWLNFYEEKDHILTWNGIKSEVQA